jgi:hypothetical protein
MRSKSVADLVEVQQLKQAVLIAETKMAMRGR